jgi:hypothetical protein
VVSAWTYRGEKILSILDHRAPARLRERVTGDLNAGCVAASSTGTKLASSLSSQVGLKSLRENFNQN